MKVSETLIESLKILQRIHFSVYIQAHEAHWNIKGGLQSESHHLLFKDIYTDMWNSLDPLSENIRKLDGIVPHLVLVDLPKSDEGFHSVPLIKNLISAFEFYLQALEPVIVQAEKPSTQGILNFLADRQDKALLWRQKLKDNMPT